MLGVVNGEPLPIDVPPVEAENHLNVPVLATADKDTVPVPQRSPGVVPVIVGIVFTVAKTAVLPVDTHPLSTASA